MQSGSACSQICLAVLKFRIRSDQKVSSLREGISACFPRAWHTVGGDRQKRQTDGLRQAGSRVLVTGTPLPTALGHSQGAGLMGCPMGHGGRDQAKTALDRGEHSVDTSEEGAGSMGLGSRMACGGGSGSAVASGDSPAVCFSA